MALSPVLESKRLTLQSQLDSAKTLAERNKLGQFPTPTLLATEILEYARALLPPTGSHSISRSGLWHRLVLFSPAQVLCSATDCGCRWL